VSSQSSSLRTTTYSPQLLVGMMNTKHKEENEEEEE
jgi:hypothetical protein